MRLRDRVAALELAAKQAEYERTVAKAESACFVAREAYILGGDLGPFEIAFLEHAKHLPFGAEGLLEALRIYTDTMLARRTRDERQDTA